PGPRLQAGTAGDHRGLPPRPRAARRPDHADSPPCPRSGRAVPRGAALPRAAPAGADAAQPRLSDRSIDNRPLIRTIVPSRVRARFGRERRLMKKIRAGIIGSGMMGPIHTEALRRLGYVEVVALAEATDDLARAKSQALH